MLLTQVLRLLTYSVWIVFLIWVITSLWRTGRTRGVGTAIRQLFGRIPLALILLAIGLNVLYLSILFVEPQEIGVVISLVAPDGYRDRPLRSGLRWIVPLAEQVVPYPISWQTYTMSSKPTEGTKTGNDSILARTSDGQEVSIDSSVIFQIDPEEVIRIHIEWQGRYIEDFVRPIVRGLVRTQVSQYTVDEVNSSKRLDLEHDLDTQVRAVFREKGLILDRFVLRNIAFSPEYAAAVEQKQIALQQQIEADYQAERTRKLAEGEAEALRAIAKGESDAALLRAQGESEATRVRAKGEADALALIEEQIGKDRNLLTYQYIQKLAPSIRTMLLPSSGQYILPLPTFDEPIQATATVTGTLTAPSTPSAGTPTPTATASP